MTSRSSDNSAKSISVRLARQLLQNPGGELSKDLTAEFLVDVYRLKDGRILFVDWDHPGAATLWESERALRDAISELDMEESHGRHILDGILPFHQEFRVLIPKLLEDLSSRVCMTPSQSLVSGEGIRKVDKWINDQDISSLWSAEIAPILIAYVGEIIRNVVDGKWEMRPSSDDPSVLEPYIVDTEGKAHNPFQPLYEVYDTVEDEVIRANGLISLAIPEYASQLDSK